MSFLFFKFKKFAVGFAVFVFIFFGVLPDLALAVLYQPGETLNPLCAPTDINCGVILITGGNIIPDVNNVYDLGSPTRQWRDLYLSGNTLHLGSLSLSASASTGALVWSGSSIETTPSATSTSELKFSELAVNGVNYTGFKSPDALAANLLYILPSADGTGGQTLSTNGGGALSWVMREPAITIGAATQYYRGDKTFQTLDTSAVPENNNLYYTDARSRSAFSVFSPLAYNSATGVFNVSQASSTASGYLSSVDWTAFNNKQTSALNNSQILIGNASNIATGATISGDAAISNAGVLTISNDAVVLAKLAADAVNSAKIVDGSIALADLASGSVDSAKITDVTITNADVSTTAAILYSKLALGNSIVLSDLTADSVNSSKVVDGSMVAADLASDAITSAKILDGTITNTDVSATAAIALSKLASGTSGQIIVADASGVPVYIALSGDANVSNAGALTIANLAITNAKLAADSVTSEKILDGTIVAADIGADAVTTVKILDGNITTAKILDANVTLAKLSANSVDSSKIVDGAIVSADISATAGITNAQLANSTIGLTIGTSGTDVNVLSPAALGNSLTLNIPDAGATARGLVTTGNQTFVGDKTFYGGLKTESTVGAIMTAGSDGAFAYNFGSGVSNSLSKRVAQSSDDAEQSLATNGVNLTSSDLELVNDTGVDQEVGIRFQNITIPQGATITNAYVEFTINAVTTGTTNLNFYGEAADNAATFTSATNNITGRTKTSSTVAWSAVPAWNTIGATNQTPNLAPLVQEIVNRAGWLSGNSLAIIINGTAGSLRNAVSYNGGASSAALLVVQYITNSTNVSYVINNLGPGLFRINDEFNDTSPFVIDSSGNVGIGTSTPSNTLSVSGNSTFSGTLNVSGASTLATTTASSLTLSPMTQGSLLFAGAGGLISQNNSNLFWDNTNSKLGIGTATPVVKLEVAQNEAIKMGDGFFSSGGDFLNISTNNWFNGTAWSSNYENRQGSTLQLTAGDAVFFSSTAGIGAPTFTERMTIKGSGPLAGNVGIGDTSPVAMLTVGNGDLFQVNSSGNIVNLGGAAHSVNNSSGALVIDSAGAGALNIGAGANGKTITLGNTTVGTTLAFNAGDTTTGNINFDSGTLYVDTVNNRVGVGTASPGAKLHIVGISNTAGFLFDIADIGAAAVPFKIAGTDAGTASTVLSSTVLTNNTTGGNQNVMLIENAAGSGVTDTLLKLNNADTDTAVVDGLLITSANGLITDAIDVSGTNITNAINIGGNKIVGDSLSIDGDGNVGIGTIAPSTKLSVVGDGLINSQVAAVGAGATQRGLQIISGALGANDGAIRGLDISATVSGTTNIGDELTGLRVETGAIDANGTTRGLHIVQPSTVGVYGSVVKDLLTLERSGGTLTNALQYVDAGVTKFVLNSAGNVGLGTSAPSASLHIVPSTAVALRLDAYGASTGNTAEIRFQELAANGANYTGFKSPDSLAGNVLYTLPTADGLQNQILATDGAGGLSWATAAVSATAMPQLVDETVQQGGIGNIFIYRNQLYTMGDSASALGEDGVYDALTPIVVPIQNPPSGWTQVVTTYDSACALSNVGTVYCWGKNNYGQLGDGSTTDNFKYAKQISNGAMPVNTVITKIFTNRNRAYSVLGGVVFALASDGKLYAWGANYQGQIGDGTTTQRNTPVLVGSAALAGKIITKVSVNGTERVSVAAIDSTGQLYTWGYNEVGQLGQGDITQRTSPTAVAGFTNVSDVISSGDHTWNGTSGSAQNYIVALKTNGTVWAAGANGYGQLGDGSTTQRNNFTQESTLRTDISKIYAGGFMNTAMVSATGDLYLTGYNGDGQLGDNTTTNRNAYFAPTGSFQGKVSKVQIGGRVYTGYGFIYILDTDGNVWAAGRNAYGQLGKGNTTGGATYFTKSLRNTDGKKVIDFRTFGFEDNSGTIILLEDGSLMTTGNNGNGESGNTVQATYSTSFRYIHGFEPGSKSTTVGSTVPMNLLSGAQSSNTIDNANYTQALNWSTLTSGAGLALSGAGLTSGSLASLSAASPNFSGSILNLTSSGDSSSVTGALAGLNISGATSGATGLKITNTGVGLSADISGAVAFRKGVDYSTAGATNDAPFSNTSLVRLTGANPVISGIAGGTDGKILTIMNVSGTTATFQNQNFGSFASNRIITGTGGDLALGADSSVNLQYDSAVSRWRIISSLGTVGAVASTPVNNYIPQLMDASIIFGRLGNIFIYRNQLYSMGLGSGYPYGPSGDAIANNSGTPSLVPVSNPPSGWNQVVGTYDSACALSNVGTVYCWGLNSSGQLGQGDTTARYLATKVTFPGGASTITSITTNANFEYSGAYTTFYAIDSTGKVWAWGANNWGQLGDGTTVNKTTPAQVGSAVWAGKAITKISASGTYAAHAAAIDSTGQLYTWGYNGVGELGQGDTIDRSNPTAISGFTSVTDVKTIGGHNGTAPVGETFVLKSDGTVWGAGRNADGELGDGTTTNRSSFIQATGVSGITGIFAGEHNAAVVNSSGNVSLTGWNGYGQLGNSSTVNALTYISPSGAFQGKVSKVVITGISSSGAYATIYILDTDGNLWTAGYNGRGQLGVGGTANTTASTPGIFQKVIRNTDGAKIIDVSAFGYDTRGGALIVLDNGALMTTGDNQQGAAGNDVVNQNYNTTFKYVIGFEPGSKVYTTASSPSLSSIIAATAANTIDNTNWTQTLNWSTLTSGNALSFGANALTTGSLLSLTSSNSSLNSTSGLLYVANLDGSTSGVVARIQSNNTAGSGLTVLANGNVGIGTTMPSQILHVARSTDGVVARFTDANGDCDINPTSTALVCASDASLKKNVVTMDSTLEKILALNPVIFDWNKEEYGAGNHIGFIAQDVEKLFPALVSTNEDGLKSIAYSNFAPILTKAIQEIASLADSFKQSLITWFADAANGITDFFAKKIHTEQICLKKADGNEYCVNGDNLEAIMNGRGEVIITNQEVRITNYEQEITNQEQGPDLGQQEIISIESAPMEIAPTEPDLEEFSPAEIAAATTAEEVSSELIPATQPADGQSESHLSEGEREPVQISDEPVSDEPAPAILDSTDESNAILPIETVSTETAPEITSLPESLPVITGATITE